MGGSVKLKQYKQIMEEPNQFKYLGSILWKHGEIGTKGSFTREESSKVFELYERGQDNEYGV